MKSLLNLLKILIILFVFFSSAFGVGQEEEYPEVAKLITEDYSGVVQLIITDGRGSIISSASAVFIASDQLSTAAHVLRAIKSPIEKHLFFVDPKTKNHIAVTQILQLDLKYDQAILKVENYKSDSVYPLETETAPENIVVVGFPEADFKIVSGHILNQFDFFTNIVFSYFGEATGMSGGAVLNQRTGRLIGVLVRGLSFNSYVQLVSAERVKQLLLSFPLDCVYEDCYQIEKDRLKSLADANDPIAQYALAFLYRDEAEGEGEAFFNEMKRSAENNFALAKYILADLWQMKGNESEAVRLYIEAAETGIVGAGYQLGILHLDKGDMEGAFSRFQRASERGFTLSEYIEGMMCYYGDGMENEERDFVCAADKIKKAAEKTLPPAELQLGIMYLKGEGVEQDETTGMLWIERSAARGWGPAIEALKELNR